MEQQKSLDPYKNPQDPKLISFDKETLSLFSQLLLQSRAINTPYSANLERIKKEAQGR